MKYYILNLVAWIAVVSFIIFAVVSSGAFQDSRIKIIHISNQSSDNGSTNMQGETENSEKPSPAETNKILFTNDKSDSLIYYSSSPEAVQLNDSSLLFFETGNYKAAIDLLQEALKLDSTYARAYYNLGVANHRSNMLGNAIKFYEKASSIRPYYYEPTYNLGVLYTSIDKNFEAITWFKKAAAIKGNRTSASAHYNLGILYKKIDKPIKSEASYREALRLRPDYIEARFNLALLKIDQGDCKTGVKELEKCKNLGFNKPKLYRNLGLCYNKLGQYEKAVLAYQKRAELENSAVSWYNLAILNKKIGKFDEAIAAYVRCLESDSAYYQASYNLAALYNKLDKKDSALFYYQQAVTFNTHYSKAYYNIALIHYSYKQFDSAITYYNRVIELDPENMKALYNLGLSYNKINKLQDAADIYSKLIDRDPTNIKGLHNLGTAYLKLKVLDSALVIFNRLVHLSQDPKALYNRAKVYSELGDINKAKVDYEKAIEFKIDYAKAYHNLAILEEKSENYTKAVNLLNKAIEYDSNNWKSHWKLGQVLVKMNQFDDAMNEYAIAANSNPSSEKFKKEYDEIFK